MLHESKPQLRTTAPESIFSHGFGAQERTFPRSRVQEGLNTGATKADSYIENLRQKAAYTQASTISANRTGVSVDSPWRNPQELFGSQDVVGRILLTDDGSIGIDLLGYTTAPLGVEEDEYHGLAVVTDTNGNRISTYGDLTVEALINLHKNYGLILRFLEEHYPNNHSYIGLNVSPLESCRLLGKVDDPLLDPDIDYLFPRTSVQTISQMHFHIHSSNPFNWEAYDEPNDSQKRRMLREPMLPQLNDIFHQLVFTPVMKSHPDLDVDLYQVSDYSNYYPKGILQVFNRNTLTTPELSHYIADLHQCAEGVFREIAGTMVDLEDYYQGKVTYLAVNEQQERQDELLHRWSGFLRPSTSHFLRWIFTLPHPEVVVPPSVGLKERSAMVESFILLGLAYNLVYYIPPERPESIVIAAHPRIITSASPSETFGVIKRQRAATPEEFQPIRDRSIKVSKALFDWLDD